MKKSYYLYLLFGVVPVILLFFSSFKAGTGSVKAVKEAVYALAESEEMKQGQVSFSLLNKSGQTLVELNPHKSLAPASNIKALTTAAALDLLGKDYKYETSLAYSGTINSGVLNGDIIIKGSGDPTLGSATIPGNPDTEDLFNIWVSELKKLGIKKVSGNIIADPGNFHINTIPDGWIWTDIGNYFGAGAGGLNLNENLYKLYFKPGAVGEEAIVLRTEPHIPYLNFINEMKTGKPGSGDNGYIYGGIFSNLKYLRGSIPAGPSEFSIKGSIPDPAYYAAYSFNNFIRNAGISVSGKPLNLQRESGEREASSPATIHTHKSPSLQEIAKATNYKSINLYAEAILNTLGHELGKTGSTEAGLEVIEKWLKEKGINAQEAFLYDGSGLSPGNAVSSNVFTNFLFQVKNLEPFVSSLPVAGESGTLSYLCRNTKAEGKVLAKSGSFESVLCYSGYIKNQEGQLLPFSILVNNYQGSSYKIRKQIEKVLIAATDL